LHEELTAKQEALLKAQSALAGELQQPVSSPAAAAMDKKAAQLMASVMQLQVWWGWVAGWLGMGGGWLAEWGWRE